MVIHYCITCGEKFEVPFNHKDYQVWLEINTHEGKGKRTGYKYDCPKCLGLDVLKCEYLNITKVFSGKLAKIID